MSLGRSFRSWGARSVSLCAVILAATSAARAQQPIARASVDANGVEADAASATSRPAISADGRYVAFDSAAGNLVPGDTKSIDVFVKDRQTGAIVRVSVDSSGVEADGASSWPALSADGRFVAFESVATNLVANDTNGDSDVFVHDRDPDGNGIFDEGNGTTVRVSVHSNGTEGDRPSERPSISGDGALVAFASEATNLTANDRNNRKDIFLHDLAAAKTTRISLSSAGIGANGDCFTPAISEDGVFVAFMSLADNLVANDFNLNADIFVRDRVAKTTERVSVDSSGQERLMSSFELPSISDDGSVVCFTSAASFVPADVNFFFDVYVHDRTTKITELVSVDSSGAATDDFCLDGVLSADGQIVVFASAGSTLDPSDDNDTLDIYAHDRTTGLTTLLSANALLTVGDDFSYFPAVSDDGLVVAFGTVAANLVAGDTNQVEDVLVRDRSIADPDASWTNYGAGFPGTNGIPALTASADPVLGTSITVDVGNSLGAPTAGVLLAGLAPASIPTTRGGTLLVGSLAIVLPLAIDAGGESLVADLPFDLAWAGLRAFVQVLEIDAGAAFGISFTPGLELAFGN